MCVYGPLVFLRDCMYPCLVYSKMDLILFAKGGRAVCVYGSLVLRDFGM